MNTATWNNHYANIWNRVKPPIRPYDEELVLFRTELEKIIKHKKDIVVLILGSTPELRDIAYSYGLNVIVVDYSYDNYRTMGNLCEFEPNDSFICCDWLNMLDYIPKNSVDVIMGEAAFNVIRPKYVNQLFDICNDLLKADGRLIIKEWIRLSDDRPSIGKLLQDYREKQINQDDFYFSLCYPLHILYYDFENEVVCLRDIDSQLRKLCNLKVITEDEYADIGKLDYQKVDLKVYIPKEDDFTYATKSDFRIVSKSSCSAKYANQHPIYVLKKAI